MADEMMLILNDDGVAHIYDETYDIVIHCESAEKQKEVEKRLMGMDWIPCSERLPKLSEHKEGMVLVCYGNGSVRFNACWHGEWVQGNPLAWMPLPECYTGE